MGVDQVKAASFIVEVSSLAQSGLTLGCWKIPVAFLHRKTKKVGLGVAYMIE